MTDPLVQLVDLPDEILIYIFKKLYNVEALCSLTGVNQRLNRIVHDSIFTSRLHMLLYSSVNKCISPLPDIILHPFCSEVLPQIGPQVKVLIVETTSMKRIFHATNYPNLRHFGIYDMEAEVAKTFFVDENSLGHIQKKQILSFFINFCNKDHPIPKIDTYPFILARILTIFPNLRCLKFNPSSFSVTNPCFNLLPTIISSSLSELHISVHGISDCLYLLDGRFDQLRALYISLFMISSDAPIKQKKLLPNLRIFSLHCNSNTSDYDVSIVPLLHCMVNLEELHLDIIVRCYERLVDGDALKKDIMHMPRLHKFTFYIYSILPHFNETNIVSNQSSRKTFEYFFDNRIISYIDHFQEARFSQCHIYSYPYKMKIYRSVTNNFPGGICKSVTEVLLYDERPFEYDFFVRIAQAFPFMQELTIKNRKAQKNKQLIKPNNDNQPLSTISFVNLKIVRLAGSHSDYVELFLFDSKISLLNDLRFGVDYESLERVTYGFTRTITGSNCEKLSCLFLYPKVAIDERIKNYLPHTYIHTY